MTARRAGQTGDKKGRHDDVKAERLYLVDDAATGRRALAAVREAFDTKAEKRGSATRTYFDTFDRRVAGAEGLISVAGARGEREVRWETFSGRLQRRMVSTRNPAFARDLPAGPFRDALERVIDVRKLLPVMRVRGRAERLRVLGKGGKTVARVALESWSHEGRGRDARGAELPMIRLSPVRGYGKAVRAVIRVLEKDQGLRPLTGAAFAELLGLAGAEPAEGGAWPPPLTPGTRADEAMREVFRGLLATMRANEAGTRKRTDPEFLHEYRVALRRTRAGLARLGDLFPKRDVQRFKSGFSWLGTVTGPMRDADVQLLDLPGILAALPADSRRQLEPLRPWLEAEGDRAQAVLVKALDSARYRRLLEAWSAFLDRAPSARSSIPEAARPIEDVARERIWKLHTRVVKRGTAIDDETPAARVHDLRLDAKKLRYLIEFFRTLFAAGAIKKQVAALKRLQDVLGRFNDYEVQQHAMQEHAAAMAEAGTADLETVLAIGRIVESLRAKQDRARSEVEGRVATFATARNLDRAARLFAPCAAETK